MGYQLIYLIFCLLSLKIFTHMVLALAFVALVSIHARHRWRANRHLAPLWLAGLLVSIHARHRWRANQRNLAARTATCLFQSTPAIAGGRIMLPEYRRG